MKRLALLGFAAALALASCLHGAEATHPTLTLGSPAPDFDLPGVDDQQYSLNSFAQAKILVVIFTCNSRKSNRPRAI